MRAVLTPLLAILLVAGLTACAERGPTRPAGTAVPPPSAPAKVAPPPGAAEPAGSGTAPAAAPAPDTGQAAPAKPGQPSEEDVADCYRYAKATVEHDRRIERDRGSSFGFGSLGSDVGAISSQLSRVGEGSTFDRAYASCMAAKGYGKQ
ncbi:hypothetical protein SAMN06265365_13518 [Tistlia consotensis]|uniref:Lipoprotein n=1 Tax=Tistlia consotensis USBA 355 TaxID=560819 RepID=A0A1Y6CND7_9PROT|nr:hypothetical protein [Tistlia consotensis]SMF79820.1 hypothetical protein SAMN05428998_14033 [Tistlia consotensis USBA 355]SNS16676.1 hypothetical protein SAMN06265365_13518 [Tistlia consotensis]